jgi:hypothetical protein
MAQVSYSFVRVTNIKQYRHLIEHYGLFTHAACTEYPEIIKFIYATRNCL